MLSVWRYPGPGGTERLGVFARFTDYGGTDVSYYFHRLDESGRVMPEGTARLDIVSGPRLQRAACVGAMPDGGTYLEEVKPYEESR